MSRVSAKITKVDKTLDRNTSIVDKKINAVRADLKKSQQQQQQSMLLPMLLQKPPQLTSLKLKDPAKPAAPPILWTVEDPEYAKGDNLLPLLMMMGGGLGGSGGGAGNSLFLLLALSGGLSGK